MVLHSEWWLRAHWGRAFDVVDVVAGAVADQDLVVLERPRTPAPSVEAMTAPERGEPRELVAALHAIELANREHAELNRRHDAYAEAYHAELARTQALQRDIVQLRHQLEAAGHFGLKGVLRSVARRALRRP
jgi:hypothetical protein